MRKWPACNEAKHLAAVNETGRDAGTFPTLAVSLHPNQTLLIYICSLFRSYHTGRHHVRAGVCVVPSVLIGLDSLKQLKRARNPKGKRPALDRKALRDLD